MGNKEGDIRRLRPISQACGPKEFPDDRDTSFALPAVDAGHSWHLSSAQRASFGKRIRELPERSGRGDAPGFVPATEREAQSTRKVCEPSLNTMSENSARAVPCWKLLTAISHTRTIRAGGGPIAASTSAYTCRSSAHH